MRFGISEISWMLPKILRIRRELVFSPLVVLRGASIALVAMCFPALCEAHANERPAESAGVPPAMLWSAAPLPSPMRSVRAPTRTLSRRGREKPRTHAMVRPEPICLDESHIILFQQGARLGRTRKSGTPEGAPPLPEPDVLVARRQAQRHRPRCAVINGADAADAREFLGVGLVRLLGQVVGIDADRELLVGVLPDDPRILEPIAVLEQARDLGRRADGGQARARDERIVDG